MRGEYTTAPAVGSGVRCGAKLQGDLLRQVWDSVALAVCRVPCAAGRAGRDRTRARRLPSTPLPREGRLGRIISKSKFVAGLQCEKLLWYHYRRKDEIPPPDADTLAIFAVGHRVGDLAKRLYPDGVEVPMERGRGGLAKTVERTRELLPERKPLFEASFVHQGGYCRTDLLVPVENGAWDLIEVKSGTRVKPVNLEDVAFQKFVLTGEGVRLNRLFVMHVNRDCVRRGEVDPKEFFHAEDVTDEAEARVGEVSGRLGGFHATIGGAEPVVGIGKQCSDPYECPLKEKCWGFLPEHSVAELYRVRKGKALEWIRAGRLALADIGSDHLSEAQRVQQAAVVTGRRQVDRDAVRAWLGKLRYPVYCMDFETIMPGIPVVEGTRPYQHIPVQFSVHVLPAPGEAARHEEFLADGAGDPRPAFLAALKEAIGPEGTVLAFNMAYEERILNEVADALPEARVFVEDVAGRMEDLADPFRRFRLYHPEQRGSNSLKRVLPAWTGAGYESLGIQEGGAASREYERVTYGDAGAEERGRVREDLLRYCERDTEAMVELLAVLEGEG